MKQLKTKNPLSGKAYFDKGGSLWLAKGIKFGGQLNPPIKIREWFYLILESCKEKEIPEDKVRSFIKNILGSKATQWRIKNKLIQKGHL